ncbi:MAG: tRNA (adenosine(37)-N6)-threonylcarbamoyltransferase complex ATPase subunit type 1 TsaE [Nevskiales bacterium]
MTPLVLALADEQAMLRAGRMLARGLGQGGGVITLQGELGAGKTTFVRGLLGGLGFHGRVKSPTYTLLEPYEMDGRTVYHLDLYRLAHVGELNNLGIGDLEPATDLLLIEWPERGGAALPPVDLAARFHYAGAGRALELDAQSQRADAWLAKSGLS